MKILPKKLCRNAIKSHFTKLTSAQWDRLFEHEKKNGLHALRTKGSYEYKAYYKTQEIIQWLVSENHYTAEEFKPLPASVGNWSPLSVKTHSLGI